MALRLYLIRVSYSVHSTCTWWFYTAAAVHIGLHTSNSQLFEMMIFNQFPVDCPFQTDRPCEITSSRHFQSPATRNFLYRPFVRSLVIIRRGWWRIRCRRRSRSGRGNTTNYTKITSEKMNQLHELYLNDLGLHLQRRGVQLNLPQSRIFLHRIRQ